MENRGSGTATSDYGIKEVIAVYNTQNSALKPLWTMYVVATFTAGAFAATATDAGRLALLLAGGIGFLAFTIGHFSMVMNSIDLLNSCAADLARLPAGSDAVASLERLSRPYSRIGAILVHLVIDACVVGAYVYCIGIVLGT